MGETAFSALDNMADVLYFTPIYPGMRQFLENLVAPLYKQLSWTEDAGESIEVAKLRSLILKKMCSYGNAEALQKAQDILLSYRQTGGKIAPNLRDIVYVHGMQGLDTWKWMLDLYKVENNAQEKLKLLRGLCSSGQPWILSHLLDLTWDESIVRRQDYFTLITYMSWNRIGEPIVWDFVRNNWPRLVQRFTLNDRLMGRMLSDIVKILPHHKDCRKWKTSMLHIQRLELVKITARLLWRRSRATLIFFPHMPMTLAIGSLIRNKANIFV